MVLSLAGQRQIRTQHQTPPVIARDDVIMRSSVNVDIRVERWNPAVEAKLQNIGHLFE